MTFAVLKKQTYKVSFFNTVRDYTDEETPCSIPNQEAKLIMADDTLRYSDVGKVGRCGLCFILTLKFNQSKFN